MNRMLFAVTNMGWTHLPKPPVTLWLARRVLGLDRAFAALPPLAGRIAQIMALTAITLPTVLGAICGAYPDAVLLPGPTRCVAFLVAGGLWTPRLLAQLLWVG